jgi:hypothetical protein
VRATDPKRLTGVRVPYAQAPDALHAWVEDTIGARVTEVVPRHGGMSPAVAATLRFANGERAFVKAVGAEINPVTPTHFRHELAALQALPPAPYRAELLGVFDDDDWVGLLLEDVEGDHPDWSSRADRDLVLDAVRAQSRELTPPPPGVPQISNRIGLTTYVEGMRTPSDAELAGLPLWARARLPELADLTTATLDHQTDESFCHWDLRHDNILVRAADRQPFLLDWGMSRLGQRWSDLFVFAVEWAEEPEFDRLLDIADLSRSEQDDVTGFLAGLGAYLLMMATHPPPPGLPNLPAFRRELGGRCLQGVHRRLGLR